MVKAVCDHDALNHTQLQTALQNPVFACQLTEWVNAGYWYFKD